MTQNRFRSFPINGLLNDKSDSLPKISRNVRNEPFLNHFVNPPGIFL
jgi:hypothetical protein